jgi:hypothetical protein
MSGVTPDNLMPDHYHPGATQANGPAITAGPRADPGYLQQLEEQTLFDRSDFVTPGAIPVPGDKIRDDREGWGDLKTVLEPRPPGIECRCGVPTFGPHTHQYAPGSTNPEFPVFGQDQPITERDT